MPAPAVIPAPIAYINAAAVKKLVVGSGVRACGAPSGGYCTSRRTSRLSLVALN